MPIGGLSPGHSTAGRYLISVEGDYAKANARSDQGNTARKVLYHKDTTEKILPSLAVFGRRFCQFGREAYHAARCCWNL